MISVIDKNNQKHELLYVTALFRENSPSYAVFEMQHSNRSHAHAHEEKKTAKDGVKQMEMLKFRRARADITYFKKEKENENKYK